MPGANLQDTLLYHHMRALWMNSHYFEIRRQPFFLRLKPHNVNHFNQCVQAHMPEANLQDTLLHHHVRALWMNSHCHVKPA